MVGLQKLSGLVGLDNQMAGAAYLELLLSGAGTRLLCCKGLPSYSMLSPNRHSHFQAEGAGHVNIMILSAEI